MSATLSTTTRRGKLNNMAATAAAAAAGKTMSAGRRPASGGGAAQQQQQEEVNKMLINVKGLRHTVYSINGDEYTGGWKGFQKHGKGTYKWKASRHIYEGNWEDNKRSGFGTLIVPKEGGSYRMEYSGEWLNDKKHGQGSHFYSQEEYYEGQWMKGKRSGWGVMTLADGTVYEGNWAADERSGLGTERLTNGDRYEGEWVNDQKHGAGKFFYQSRGQVYEGIWKEGVPRCGELRDIDRSAPGAPEYSIPKVELCDAQSVLGEARDHVLLE